MALQKIIFGSLLEEEETIEKAFRRPFPLTKILFWLLLGGGIAFGLRWFFFWDDDPAGIWVYLGIGGIVLYKISAEYFFWYANAILMTSETLMFVTWKKLFEPKSARLDYWDLDAIEVDREGLGALLGNYGNLNFSKISGGDPVVFTRVASPHRTEAVLSANREKMHDEKNFTEQSALKELISGMVDTHVRKNGQPERPKSNNSTIEVLPTAEISAEIFTKSSEVRTEKPQKHHFVSSIEVEKELDDEGGIELDLDETDDV